jgi:hypothetical protein
MSTDVKTSRKTTKVGLVTSNAADKSLAPPCPAGWTNPSRSILGPVSWKSSHNSIGIIWFRRV